jgi:hypothetical protein
MIQSPKDNLPTGQIARTKCSGAKQYFFNLVLVEAIRNNSSLASLIEYD